MRNKKLIVLFVIVAFVTLVAVLGSVLFSVQAVYASCYNDDDTELSRTVADWEVSGIRRGKSIFLLSEREVSQSVTSHCANVKVINVERKFPNIVYINYVKILPYLAFEREGSVYYASNDLRILSSGEAAGIYPDHVRLIASAAPASTAVGENLFSLDSQVGSVTAGILEVIERMDLHREVIDMFEAIDVTTVDDDGTTFVVTRTGACFEIRGGADKIGEKLRLAVSLYLNDGTKYMGKGTIIVYERASDGVIKADYTTDDRYSKRSEA